MVVGWCALTLTGVTGATRLGSMRLSVSRRPVRDCSHSNGRNESGSPVHSPIYVTVASHLLTSHCQKLVIWGSHMLSVRGWDSCPSTVSGVGTAKLHGKGC